MIHEVIHLNQFYKLKNDPTLEVFVSETLDGPKRPISKAMLVLPGGGYSMCSKREGDPIAIAFMAKNYVAFKLIYTCYPTDYFPSQHLEVMAAMDFIRTNADKYSVDPNKIAVIGFSAGGHLAASYGYLYKDAELVKLIGLEGKDLKPNACVLCYPVITFSSSTHGGSRNNLTNNNPALFDRLSCELHVDSDYAPTFLWTTEDDQVVPYQNTTMMKEALDKAGIKNECIIYPTGPHGLSTASEDTCPTFYERFVNVTEWVDKAAKFLKGVFD